MKDLLQTEQYQQMKRYFSFPLSVDPMGCYVYDSQNSILFSTADLSTDYLDLLTIVVEKLNGGNTYQFKAKYKDEILNVNGIPLLEVRGWGYLTSLSSCNLSDEQAAGVQDYFGNLCAEILRS